MHSERILIFEPPESKLRKAGVGHGGGVIVALKRRFNNVWVDEEKQLQLDTFLGLRHSELFTNAYLYYKVWMGHKGIYLLLGFLPYPFTLDNADTFLAWCVV